MLSSLAFFPNEQNSIFPYPLTRASEDACVSRTVAQHNTVVPPVSQHNLILSNVDDCTLALEIVEISGYDTDCTRSMVAVKLSKLDLER